MNNFMEKWNSDSKFKTKIKLSLYTLFVIFVAIFATSSRNNIPTNEIQSQTSEENSNINNIENETNNDVNNKVTIDLPNEYNYKINIKINETNYQYSGNKNSIREIITKTVNDIDTNYIYENNNYYKENATENYILTTKDEVYDVIEYNYLDIDTINTYLTKSTKIENKYLVYLKDIILGNDSQDYITISIDNNKFNIDYTNLLKYFDKSIIKYIVEIEIEEIE